jgi:hypothetical protein
MSLRSLGSCIVLGVLLSFIQGCGHEDFLYQLRARGQVARVTCKCESGFLPTGDFHQCVREQKIAPSIAANPLPIIQGDVDGSYYCEDAVLTSTTSHTAWPFLHQHDTSGYTSQLYDANQVALPSTHMHSPYWISRVLGPNRVTIKSASDDTWMTKTFCVDISAAQSYVLHVGADNNWKIKIDGQDFASCGYSYCFKNGAFMEQEFATGKHLVELKYINEGGPGAVWFEVFNNTLPEIKAAAQDSDLNTIYSTKNLVGDFWDYSGEICPVGYAYDVCSQDKMCTKIEHADCG